MVLATRWDGLWTRLGLDGDAAPMLAELVGRYSEPHRAYHTLEHLEHCFAELDQARSLAAEPDTIELALWFHDAVYDTHASDSEEQSAHLLRARLLAAKAPEPQVERAAGMVLATRHTDAATDAETALLLDVDLAILGQSEVAFDVYEAAIRREYAWVPEPAFRQGRAAVLSRFLARPAIYATEHFRDLFEKQARANLIRSLAALSA